jgi:hypothetical protein
MQINRYFVLGTLVLSTLGTSVVVACSSDETSTSSSSSSGGSSSGQTDDTVTVRVSAAAGGSVSDKDGKAKLDIPPGALEKDTDITLKLSEKSGAAVVEIADFGPDGLTFLKPATLELKADAALAPAGKSLAVAMEEGGAFKALTGSTYATGIAKALVEHFTKFSVIVVDGVATLVDPASCQDARAQYQPCGGDPKGVWTFADFCPDPAAAAGLDPFQGKCNGYVGGLEIVSTRELTIDATTTTSGPGTVTLKFTGDFPASCIAEATDGGTSDCTTFSNGGGTVCTDQGGGQCRCETTEVKQEEAGTPEPYTTNGSNWTGSENSGTYCVSGDVLYYRENTDSSLPLLYVLKRKQ